MGFSATKIGSNGSLSFTRSTNTPCYRVLTSGCNPQVPSTVAWPQRAQHPMHKSAVLELPMHKSDKLSSRYFWCQPWASKTPLKAWVTSGSSCSATQASPRCSAWFHLLLAHLHNPCPYFTQCLRSTRQAIHFRSSPLMACLDDELIARLQLSPTSNAAATRQAAPTHLHSEPWILHFYTRRCCCDGFLVDFPQQSLFADSHQQPTDERFLLLLAHRHPQNMQLFHPTTSWSYLWRWVCWATKIWTSMSECFAMYRTMVVRGLCTAAVATITSNFRSQSLFWPW